MKKRKHHVMSIPVLLVGVLLLSAGTLIADCKRLSIQRPPFFAFKVGYNEYIGLGYKVYYTETTMGGVLPLWGTVNDLTDTDRVSFYYVNYK